jgi:hypothetical protein
MARIRTIKPEFQQSESMARVSRDARLTFILMWPQADDSGRLRANSRILASVLFPADKDAGDLIDGWLDELESQNCIRRYSADGNSYVQICKWLDHQKIDHPTTSKIPPPTENSRRLAKKSEGSRKITLDQGLEGIKEGKGRDQGTMSAAPTDRVFDHWKSIHGHPRAKLDAKRKRVIGTALASYSEADLCLAITGYLSSPHHMGQNDRATKYDDIELMLRDAKHIEAGIKFHAEPPTNLSSLTRRNVAAIEDWRPPEVRNGTD